MPTGLVLVFELSALFAVALALGPWFARTRDRWLTARFVTEQIRQWHFQMLLDGDLVSAAHALPTKFEAERSKRFAQFTSRFASAEGARISFVAGEGAELCHPTNSYKDSETSNEVFRVYLDLRFQRQLAYFKLSRHRFATRDEWSEAIARWTLFSAVMLAAAQVCFIVLSLGGEGTRHNASIWLAASAIWLVVLSATIRVYRDATAVAQHRERYDTAWVQLLRLKASFDSATSVGGRLKIMREAELLEVEECREFLRQMTRASYLL